jgi:hypothetical protein
MVTFIYAPGKESLSSLMGHGAIFENLTVQLVKKSPAVHRPRQFNIILATVELG